MVVFVGDLTLNGFGKGHALQLNGDSQYVRHNRRQAMIKIHQLVYLLLWLGMATWVGYSQEAAGDYVAPSDAVPRGKAPRMQVQFLSRGAQSQQYAVIFYQNARRTVM